METFSEEGGRILGGRYRILRRFGSGGMAYVLLGRDENLQRDVAIKVMREDFADSPEFEDRFLQEARAAANLTHPNIVTVHDFGVDEGRFFMIMEFVDGTDLRSMINDRGSLPFDEAIDLMVQICAAVGYAHRAGLVHCDLKPQNILVTSDGRAKVADFGISRALASINPEEMNEIVWGSPQYNAPEQASGGAPSPASDVYALGVMLYEMIAGRRPYSVSDPAQLAELRWTTPIPPLILYKPDVPDAVQQIVTKVLSVEPSARYRTADQFGHVLMAQSSYYAEGDYPPSHLSIPRREQFPTRPAVRPGGAALTRVNWLAVALGLLAFLAVGGLIPLWLWICLLYPTCPVNTW